MQLRWTRRALSRLDEIGSYIAAHNPDAATRVVGRIEQLVGHLAEQPHAGRKGRVSGTRELVLSDFPYIVAYRVTPQTVDILTIMHAARRWPDKL